MYASQALATTWATSSGSIDDLCRLDAAAGETLPAGGHVDAAATWSRWSARLLLGCSSLATRPVQPVWWMAPTPRPVSPWKYSWNSTWSRKCGSFCSFAWSPKHRPPAVCVAQEEPRQPPRQLVGDLARSS